MLNRRILRVKAFQSLYAYALCKASNFQLAKDFISASFLPDLDTMEVQDKRQLKAEAETCTQLFTQSLNNKQNISGSDVSVKIKNVALQAIDQYNRTCEKDFQYLRGNMLSAIERIPQLYLTAIEILMAFGTHVANEYERKRKYADSAGIDSPGERNLANNKVLAFLREAPVYQSAVIRHRAQVQDLDLEIKQWFREYVWPLDAYKQYLSVKEPGLAEDNEILQAILKKVIFKEDPILSYFYEKDISWTENRAIVRSLALKVLKAVEEVPDQENFALPELAINWEEDKEFFQNIFNLTVQNEEEFKDLISNKTKNWDIERVASTDKIIITMALTEMSNFPSIPTKVSINEYIDISKTYSTPKSKQFVNGLLDVLAKELTESGKIRKSGRGLLDNK